MPQPVRGVASPGVGAAPQADLKNVEVLRHVLDALRARHHASSAGAAPPSVQGNITFPNHLGPNGFWFSGHFR